MPCRPATVSEQPSGAPGYLLSSLNRQLDQANKKAAADRANASAKADALEARIKELEKRAGNSLDAQAVAAEVTPSVFRVIAGEFSGTGPGSCGWTRTTTWPCSTPTRSFPG